MSSIAENTGIGRARPAIVLVSAAIFTLAAISEAITARRLTRTAVNTHASKSPALSDT